MKVTRTIGPTQSGAKKFLQVYGERLVAVRYRKAPNRRLITIEIVVDEYDAPQDGGGPRHQHAQNCEPVGFSVQYDEVELRTRIKAQGGRWSKIQKLWYLPRHQVVALGLAHRIVPSAAERCTDVDLWL